MPCSCTSSPGLLKISGHLSVEDAQEVASLFASALPPDGRSGRLDLDLGECTGAEPVGAGALFDLISDARASGIEVAVSGASPEVSSMLQGFERHAQGYSAPRSRWTVHYQFEEIGEKVSEMGCIAVGLGMFSRRTLDATLALFGNRKLLRTKLMLYYMEQSGVRAIPIIAMLCWLLGVVLGYQAGYQLTSFAAENFMPDLIAYVMTWEIAPLLAAVLVAGRSGSAFAAEIGTMKVRQEIDALKVMGFDEWSYLVTPKMLALMIVMPLLVLLADFFGLLGGLLVGGWSLGMPYSMYMDRLDLVMLPIDIWWGMLKSLVFAVIISNVGCYMGMKVRGGAAEVGRATTSAVVTSIFLVIIADALVSLIFMHVRPTVPI